MLHKVWKGHNSEYNIGSHREKDAYLKYLNEEIIKQENPIHSICIMSNHTHEVYSLNECDGSIQALSELFRRHHARYGMYFNRKQNRKGKVAQERPFTCSVEKDDAHEMELTFYIHANPLRAGLCKDAKNFYYSTHRLYAYGKKEPWMANIVFPQWYMKLGKTMKQRQARYRSLFEDYLRRRGLIKVTHCIYGWGSLLWVHKRRRQIRRDFLGLGPPPD